MTVSVKSSHNTFRNLKTTCHCIFSVSKKVKIENEQTQIKIFNSLGAVVPLEFLAEIIRKYEKEESFYLRIELVTTDAGCLAEHAVTIAKVSK